MTEEKRNIRKTPEQNALQATCVGNVGNDGISDSVAGGENSYITYITVTDDAEKAVTRLNDYTEVSIGGVVYRLKSVFSDKGQLGELLDLAAMEKIDRIA